MVPRIGLLNVLVPASIEVRITNGCAILIVLLVNFRAMIKFVYWAILGTFLPKIIRALFQ